MRTKTKFTIILSILILVGLVVLLAMLKNEDKTSNSSVLSEISPTLSVEDSIKDNQKPEKITSKLKQPILTKEKADEAVSELAFSSDPVVNTYAIYRSNQLCYSQLENSNSPSIYLQQFLERMNKKQAQYFEDFLEHCRKIDKEHPEYSLTNKEVIIAKMKEAKPNSLWGKILNKEIEAESLTQDEIIGLLKSNDINILQEAPQYFESYYQEVIHWDLENYLGSHDYDYVTYIRRYSHQVYLCDLGAQCNENSTIMASLCYRDYAACGIDFNSYINNSLTQGQQADISLALDYLRNQYQ